MHAGADGAKTATTRACNDVPEFGRAIVDKAEQAANKPKREKNEV